MVEMEHMRTQTEPPAMRVQVPQGDAKSMPGVPELGGDQKHDIQQRCSKAPWCSWDASLAWRTRWAACSALQDVNASSHFPLLSLGNALF